jgi:16S rRNA (cytosine1402-N4)-methyltransferase
LKDNKNNPASSKDLNAPGEHISVLAAPLAELIKLPKDGKLVDATLGHGGHSLMFGNTLGPEGLILGLDVDEISIKRAQTNLRDLACEVAIERINFANASLAMYQNGIKKVDLIFADLGFCSTQLENANRGMSFQENQPLDMRLDNRLKVTAADMLREKSEEELADLIFLYGEERASRRIAKFIVEFRHNQPIKTTSQLSMVVCKATGQPVRGFRKSKIHPATRTFQALRIAVNDELGCLEKLLDDAPDMLSENGKIAIISFHSLEDRIVKQNFKQNAQKGTYKILTKKPITASDEEIAMNPRSRSAKLRIAQRI